MSRPLRLLCTVGLILCWLAGCHYSEEGQWVDCCGLNIYIEDAAWSDSRVTLVKLANTGSANGEGRGGSWNPYHTKTAEKELEAFLEGDAEARPRDYFTRLGMSCTSKSRTEPDLVRCEADLSVWVQCGKFAVIPFFQSPVPKELRGLIPAVLHMSIDLAGATFVRTHYYITPVPGGRLCHR